MSPDEFKSRYLDGFFPHLDGDGFRKKLAELEREEQAFERVLERETLKAATAELERKARLRMPPATDRPARGRLGFKSGVSAADLVVRETRTGLRFKSAGDDGNELEFYGLVFGGPEDRQGDIIQPGAVSNIDEFLSDGWIAFNHRNTDLPVGYPLEAGQDEHGFRVRAAYHDTPEAKAVQAIVRERRAAGLRVLCSIGYVVNDSAAGVYQGRPVRFLKSISVYECSIVLLPANPRAEVIGRGGRARAG